MFDKPWVIQLFFCAEAVLIVFFVYLLVSHSRKTELADEGGSQSAPERESDSVERLDEAISPNNPEPECAADVADSVEASSTAIKDAVRVDVELKSPTSTPINQSSPDALETLKPYDRTRKSGPAELKSDQRKYRRCPFERVQLIAPYDGSDLPQRNEFEEVMCHDLSAQGISFYSETIPKFRRMVVGLTVGEADEKYVVCQIVRTNVIERDGRKMVLVGCRIMTRLPSESYPDGLVHCEVGSTH